MDKMISDKEWLRKIGKWEDWEDENYGERILSYLMRANGRQGEMYLKSLRRFVKANKDYNKEMIKNE